MHYLYGVTFWNFLVLHYSLANWLLNPLIFFWMSVTKLMKPTDDESSLACRKDEKGWYRHTRKGHQLEAGPGPWRVTWNNCSLHGVRSRDGTMGRLVSLCGTYIVRVERETQWMALVRCGWWYVGICWSHSSLPSVLTCHLDQWGLPGHSLLPNMLYISAERLYNMFFINLF
jgi:hypothetical protein